MSNNLRPNSRKAIEWISWLTNGAPVYVEQMSSQGNSNPKHKFYPANDATSAVRFVESNNNDAYQRNIYFVPNAEFLVGKRKKENLSAAGNLHVDLDFKDYPGDLNEQKDRILALLCDEGTRPKGIPHPTAIWFTGGGFQAVWRLTESISVELAEELNHALLVALQGGLGTHDASRLLRVPWTMNWLDDKKRSDGREPKLAFPLHPMNLDSPPVTFSVEDFQMRRVKSEPKLPIAATGKSSFLPEFEKLPLPDDLNSIIPLDQKWAEVIMTGETRQIRLMLPARNW